MDKVRAKFRVTNIARSTGSVPVTDAEGNTTWKPSEVQTITLFPVSGNGDPNHENTKFWNASPSGQIQLGTVNAEAAKVFDLDKEFYIDFTPADAE